MTDAPNIRYRGLPPPHSGSRRSAVGVAPAAGEATRQGRTSEAISQTVGRWTGSWHETLSQPFLIELRVFVCLVRPVP